MNDSGGPHLNAALICERVLAEQDGVLSPIRLIDRAFFITGEDGAPLNPQLPFTLMISLKSGSARGSYTIQVRMEKPSTEQVPLLEAPVFFEGEERGANLIVQTALVPDGPGLYWFDVLFEQQRITRIPMRVIYQSQPVAGHGG
jgi:hypothetical protein